MEPGVACEACVVQPRTTERKAQAPGCDVRQHFDSATHRTSHISYAVLRCAEKRITIHEPNRSQSPLSYEWHSTASEHHGSRQCTSVYAAVQQPLLPFVPSTQSEHIPSSALRSLAALHLILQRRPSYSLPLWQSSGTATGGCVFACQLLIAARPSSFFSNAGSRSDDLPIEVLMHCDISVCTSDHY